jgi:hypothetical protein
VSGPRLPYPLRDSDAQLFDCRLMVSMLRGGPCPVFVGDDSLVHRVRGWCFRCSFRTLPFSPLPGRLPRFRGRSGVWAPVGGDARGRGGIQWEWVSGKSFGRPECMSRKPYRRLLFHWERACAIYCPAVKP